jgi:dimethylhistidine N-methyltransferase
MSPAQGAKQFVCELGEIENDFAVAVLDGLSRAKKSLPCRFLYDARGSELFEEITRLPEYYPTRTEAGILAEHAPEIAEGFGDGGVLVEFGSGSSVKTEILLNRVAHHITYVAIDVSETALAEAKARLTERYRGLDVRTIVDDFSSFVEMPHDLATRTKSGFFPGSTIGNLVPRDAKRLLESFGRVLGPRSELIIGVDLKKDPRELVKAYNDPAGITSAFNLNLLARINRELGGTIEETAFRHEAVYDPREGRVEMHLISTQDQTVEVCGNSFHFHSGESIHTENSYKYSLEDFQSLAISAGWASEDVWTDTDRKFSVHKLKWQRGS